jgi:hypothetical protein
MIYDNDVPYPSNNYNSPFIHLLIINTTGKNDGEMIVPYVTPNPPKDSPAHKYILRIYLQSGLINNNIIINQHENFPLEAFIMNNNLKLIGELSFYTSYNQQLNHNINHDPTNGRYHENLLPIHDPRSERHHGHLLPNNNLNEKEESYCSCIIDVAAKNNDECNQSKEWKTTINGKKCYSPYAVCASRIHTSSKKCGDNYNFNNFNFNELKAYANLNGLYVPSNATEESIRKQIIDYKTNKYKNK